MFRYFILGLLMAVCTFINGQQAVNVNFLGGWHDPSLPSNGGVRYNDIWGYASDGKEFAILGTRGKVIFLDVTNPAQVSLVAAIDAPGNPNTTWRDMKTYGTFAYAISQRQSEGLLVFDLSNIANASSPSVNLIEQQTNVFTTAHNIFVDYTGYLYVVGANVGNGDVLIYDVHTNPASPAFVQAVNLPGDYVHDIYVQNHIAYCSHGGNGLYIYDMRGATTGGSYLELGRLDGYSSPIPYNHSSWTKGDYVIFADETHGEPLKVVDASVKDEMEIVETFQSNQLGVSNPTSSSGSIPHNPFVLGDLCIVSYYHDGVVFYDISDPENVTEVGHYDTEPSNSSYGGYQGCWGVYPFLPSGRIIASDVLHGLSILDPSAAFLLLPVNWKKVSATAEKNQIRINWSTSAERNNKGFWIQRQNNRKVFENLDFILPEPSKTYAFWDKKPLQGKNFYRIAQEDFDGAISYSTIVSAAVKNDPIAWDVSPNPVSSGASITLKTDNATALNLDLFDNQGRLIKEYDQLKPANLHNLILPKLDAGIYFLQDEEGRKMSVIVH